VLRRTAKESNGRQKCLQIIDIRAFNSEANGPTCQVRASVRRSQAGDSQEVFASGSKRYRSDRGGEWHERECIGTSPKTPTPIAHASTPLSAVGSLHFLRFLRDLQSPTAAPNRRTEITESIIATLVRCLEKTASQSLAAKRDWAIIAAFCSAPTRDTPRKWPVECLKTREDKVFLWSASVEVPAFKRALYLWLDWRMRSARPEQQHLFRVSEGWARSRLLFPNPQGKALSRGALRNALARLQKTRDKAFCHYTANQIRDAFIIYWTENGRFH